MSVKAKIFKELSGYLMRTLKFNQVVTENNPMPLPDLKWVDKQMGQFNNLTMFNVVPLPAILIGFRKTNWETSSRREQKGNAVITFWVYYENYADSFEGSSNQDKAIQFFDFNEAVYQALQGLEGTLFTQLERISDEDDEDHDMVIGTVFEFSTVITDDSADEFKKYAYVTDIEPSGKKVKNIEREVDEEDYGNEFIVT